MAVMKMTALSLVGPRSEMEAAARRMMLSGGFEPMPIDYMIDDRSVRAGISTDASNPYDALLTRISAVMSMACEDAAGREPALIDPNFSYEAASEQIASVASKLEEWASRRDEIRGEIDLLKAASELRSALDELHIDPAELARTEYLIPIFGSMTAEAFAHAAEAAADAPMLLVEVSRSGDALWAMVFSVTGYEDAARSMLDGAAFKERSLDEIASLCSSSDALEKIASRIGELEAEGASIERDALALETERRAELEELCSKLYTMQRIYEICRARGEVGDMYALTGWLPTDSYEKMKKELAEAAPNTTVIAERVSDVPRSGSRVPTLLRSCSLVRAFEDIVAMYSLPSYGEVDPSPFVALTFILFFGFMFGDVGHGALLFIGSHILCRRGMLKSTLAFVMKCASVSSVVFGFLYGSVMGVEDLIPAVWLSPMHDIGTLFGTAIVAGVAMISVGMILNMVRRFRDREYGQMLFGGQGLAGLLVYWGAVLAIFASVLGIDLPVPTSAIWGGVVVMLLITIFRGTLARILLREEEDEDESGAMKAFEIVHNLMDYFTNTASFVRLAAFALNHVALSFAVMLISDMLAGLPGGPVLKAAMLVAGNLFIVGLEGLIVFIQVLRLEYYEFFSKFYKGGGRAFRPVGWSKKI